MYFIAATRWSKSRSKSFFECDDEKALFVQYYPRSFDRLIIIGIKIKRVGTCNFFQLVTSTIGSLKRETSICIRLFFYFKSEDRVVIVKNDIDENSLAEIYYSI